jgi:hypothetical protein
MNIYIADLNDPMFDFVMEYDHKEFLQECIEEQGSVGAGFWHGKTRSKEDKKKMSDAQKGMKRSKEHRKKISEYRKGKSQSEETKKKIGKANKGNPNANKGIKLQTVTCPYCQKTGGKPAMMRFHYDNCKQKRT